MASTSDDAAPTTTTTVDDNNNNSRDGGEDDDDWIIQRDASKAAGDAAFRAGDYGGAVGHYTAGLSVDPAHGALLSNRSAAHLRLGARSRALHDAQACVAAGGMGIKGISRLAAALQALGRFGAALEQWTEILKQYATHAAALAGKEVCEKVLEEERKKKAAQQQQQAEAEEEEKKKDGEEEEDDDDDLGDFFDEVEEAAESVVQQKLAEAQPVATEAIKNHKKDLGTAESQIERLLPENYVWFNLNPFHVLDLPHTADAEEISRRFKALSLLLHPDKNRSLGDPERVQLAYDQVLAAKAVLYDEKKAKHVRQLIEQGMLRGKQEYEELQQQKRHGNKNSTRCSNSNSNKQQSLQDCQRVAVQKLFAEMEHTRRQVERRERSFQQREQRHEDEAATKARNERTFDKQWRDEERVDQRIGNWRDFKKQKKS